MLAYDSAHSQDRKTAGAKMDSVEIQCHCQVDTIIDNQRDGTIPRHHVNLPGQ
jgi:hypothetical protein